MISFSNEVVINRCCFSVSDQLQRRHRTPRSIETILPPPLMSTYVVAWLCYSTEVSICQHFLAARSENFSQKSRDPQVTASVCRKSLAEFCARRRKNDSDHFLRRHVRRRKYNTGCKCGICVPTAHKLCAQQTASPLKRKPSKAVFV